MLCWHNLCVDISSGVVLVIKAETWFKWRARRSTTACIIMHVLIYNVITANQRNKIQLIIKRHFPAIRRFLYDQNYYKYSTNVRLADEQALTYMFDGAYFEIRPALVAVVRLWAEDICTTSRTQFILVRSTHVSPAHYLRSDEQLQQITTHTHTHTKQQGSKNPGFFQKAQPSGFGVFLTSRKNR